MMDTQDVKIGRISDFKRTAPIDQTAILLLLRKLATRIDEQSAESKDTSERLENIENMMSQMLEELVAIKEILASSRGMGFAPEPEAGD